MKSLLVFIPNNLLNEKIGYIHGKVIYDHESDSKKFYILGIQATIGSLKSNNDIIGYYSGLEDVIIDEKKLNDWIHVSLKPLEYSEITTLEYCLKDVILDNKKFDNYVEHKVIIIYDQLALCKAELFKNQNISGNHFLELKEIVEKKIMDNKLKNNNYLETIKETWLMYILWICMYPILLLCKIANKLLPILKYSALGLHLNSWLEHFKWMLLTIIQDKRFNLKTTNHIIATILDVLLGILALQLLLHCIGETLPSQILLDNAEASENIFFSLLLRHFVTFC